MTSPKDIFKGRQQPAIDGFNYMESMRSRLARSVATLSEIQKAGGDRRRGENTKEAA